MHACLTFGGLGAVKMDYACMLDNKGFGATILTAPNPLILSIHMLKACSIHTNSEEVFVRTSAVDVHFQPVGKFRQRVGQRSAILLRRPSYQIRTGVRDQTLRNDTERLRREAAAAYRPISLHR